VDILVRNLYEAGAGFVEEIAGEEEAVAEIGEVGVDPEFPGVAEGANHFGFLGEVFVLAVFDVAAIDEGLEIGAVADAVGRVDVNHLDLAGHAFFFEEGVHDEERIAGDEAVGPAVGVAVEIDGFTEGRIFFAGFEEIALDGAAVAIAAADRFDDGARVDALMDVERDGRDFERGVLFLSGPDELGIEMGVVFVGSVGRSRRIGLRGDEADGRIVYALLPLWSYCSIGLLGGAFFGLAAS
jgi:hypothetical protein